MTVAGTGTEGTGGLDRRPDLSRGAAIALGCVAAVVLVAWVVLALGHVHDRYNVNAVSGSLLALAERAREGTLYPPLYDGQSYGGTRMMPIPIVLYAAAISIGGDLLAPAKLTDLAGAVALVLVLVAVLIRLGAGTVLSVALAGTVVASQVFLIAGAGVRPEALPTTLQLAAVALVAFRPSRSTVAVAGALSAIAIFCKISAVWAPATIVLWLLARDRASLMVYLAVLAATAAGMFAAFEVASNGRMWTNLVELGGAGLSLTGVIKAPLKTVQLLSQYAQSTLVLLPLALVGILFVTGRSRPSIFELGLLVATAVAVFVMADVGADYNHLLDVVVLVPIVAFLVVQRLAVRLADRRHPWAFLAIAVIVGSSAAFAVNAASGLAGTLGLPGGSSAANLDPRPLESELSGSENILPEDPYIALYRGERPPVMDAFMLLRIARRDPQLVVPLERSIEGGEFDAIILGEDLELPETELWFRDFAFGLPIYHAIKDSYRMCSASGGFFIYAPNDLPCPAEPAQPRS